MKSFQIIFNEFELLLSKKTKNFKFEYNSENFLMVQNLS